jgi:hypothetical protein
LPPKCRYSSPSTARPANFNGSDEFELEITPQGGRKQVQHFHVNVAAGQGGGGQGI